MNLTPSCPHTQSQPCHLPAFHSQLIARLAVAALAAGIWLLCTATVLANPVDLNDIDVASSEESLKDMLEELDTIKRRLSKDVARHSEVDQAYGKTEKKIGELAAKSHQLKQQQKELQQQLQQLQREQRALQRKAEQQQAMIAEQIRQAYQMGGQSAAQLFFDRQSPADIDRQLTYLDFVNQARAKRIREYSETLEQKQAVGQQISQRQSDLAANQAELDAQQKTLAKLQDKRQKQLARLTEKIQDDESRIRLLRTDSDALQKLLEEVNRVVAAAERKEAERRKELEEQQQVQREVDSMTREQQRTEQTAIAALPRGSFASAKGKLPWPVSGQQQYRFGKQRPGSDVRWQGVTIKAKSGEPVKAIYAGRVIFADWFQGQGLLMIVDHGDGYMSLYGHNESLLRETGTWVAGGETIATVGNSGGQSIAALYFEIRHNGAPSDPNRWCRRG